MLFRSDGKKHGKGTYCFASGAKYDGDYVDGKREGKGVFYFSDGKKYVGDFRDNKLHGNGILYNPNGIVLYSGKWENNQRAESSASGTSSLPKMVMTEIKMPNGDVYVGEVKDNKKHGVGTYYYANGNRYEGHFLNDKMQGNGIFYWKDGTRDEGNFVNGMLHGKATRYLPSGESFVGTWNYDKLTKIEA